MKLTLLAAVLMLGASPALAQSTSTPASPVVATAAAAPSPPALPYGTPITLADAQRLIDHARLEAGRRGFRMAIAVVEPDGELVAFARMDDTQYGSIYMAQRKAETAARYRQETAMLEARAQGGRTVLLAVPDILPVTGGVPIVVDGRIVGAIGVSGAASTEDNEVAHLALN